MSITGSVDGKTASRGVLGQALVLLRPHQWVKNAFVGAPLFFTPAALSQSSALLVAGGVAAFCAVSSAVYIANDFLDRESDREHPQKRLRPLAAGTVPVPLALGLMCLLVAGGLALALALSPAFAGISAAYLALNLAYSFYLKRIAILDLMVIAFGFVLRVQAGALLIAVTPSSWIIIMTGLLALFLGLAKRRDDLAKRLGGDHRRSLDGYTFRFLDTASAVVTAALLVAYLIYTTDQSVMARLGTEDLYVTAPFVVFGILRYLQITLVEERSGSPTAIVLTDPPMIATVLGWLGAFGILIHG